MREHSAPVTALWQTHPSFLLKLYTSSKIYCSSYNKKVEIRINSPIREVDDMTKICQFWMTIAILYWLLGVCCETYIRFKITSHVTTFIQIISKPVSPSLTELNDDHKHGTPLWALLRLNTKIRKYRLPLYLACTANWKKHFAHSESAADVSLLWKKPIFPPPVFVSRVWLNYLHTVSFCVAQWH